MKWNKIFRNYRLYTTLGSLLLAVVVLMDVISPGGNYPTWMVLTMVIIGCVLLCVGLFMYRKTNAAVMDERFILHRLKSSRFGLMAGLVTALGLIIFRIVTQDIISWDIFWIICAMAVGKLGAMLYFKFTA